jgi:agmatinase
MNKTEFSTAPLPAGFDPDGEATYDGIYGLPTRPEDAALVLIPVPWEVTVSYRGGTAHGPAAILAASHQVELFDRETGHPYRRGIAMADVNPRVELLYEQARAARHEGHVSEVDSLTGQLHDIVEQDTADWYARGKLVGVVGGEHGVSLGALRAAARKYAAFGMLQVDAHADLRQGYQGFRLSHAAFAANALEMVPALTRLVQVGIRDYSFQEAQSIEQCEQITAFVDMDLTTEVRANVIRSLPEKVWISLDIDGLDPSLCPHTGTPVPGGVTWREMTSLLAELAHAGKEIIGFDLNEVAPADPAAPGAGIDENVAARILYKLCGWTLWRSS